MTANGSGLGWYTEAQAARAFGVSVTTMKRWRKRGAVGFVLTPGGRIRYTDEGLRRLRLAMDVEPTLGTNDRL